MADASGNVEINISLNADSALSEADKIGNQIGQKISRQVDNASSEAGKNLSNKTQEAVSEVGQTMTDFGTSYSKAVTLPILGAATAAGAAAVKIDTALTGVRKTVDGTEEQYETLKDAAIEFSKTNAVDPAQILDIQALGAQLGYSIDELDEFGEVVSGLDIATNMNAEEAATQLAQFANIMGMSHDETKNFGSTIVDLGNNFATTEADIANMSMRIAGAGKQIGMSEADVLGLATALASMGINAEAGGSAISTIMSKIDKDVALGTDNLELWASTANMSVAEFSKVWGEDAIGALSAVLVGMDAATQSGGNMAVMLDELGISELRQTDTLKRLASNSDFLGRAVALANNAWEENIALDKEVENRNNSMESQLQILKNRVMAVAIEVGEPLMESLIGIIDAAQPLIDALASGAKAFADLDDSGKQTVLTVIGIVAAFGPATATIGKLMTVMTGGTRSWATFRENVAIARENIAASASAAAAGSGAFNRYFSIIRNGERVFYRWNNQTQSYIRANRTLASTLATSAVGMRAQAVASRFSATAMRIASTAARAFSAALKTIAPIAIFGLIVEAFTAISSSISEAQEHSDNYKKATEGLQDALNTTSVSVQAESEAFGGLASSVDGVNIDELIDQHIQLADTLRDTTTSANNSTAILDQYRGVIEQMAGQALTSEADVAKLKLAVDKVNESCGTSYEVVQDAGGAYQIMADGAIVAKDSILDLIKAQEAQIRLDAAKSNYEAAFSQLTIDSQKQAEALKAQKDAQDKLNRVTALFNKAREQGDMYSYASEVQAAQEELNDANTNLAETQGMLDATQSAANRATEQMVLFEMATQENANALIIAAANNQQYISGVQATGTNLIDFTQALLDMGYTASDVSNMSAENAMNMAQGWRNGTDQLIAASERAGVQVPEALRETGGRAIQVSAEMGKSLPKGIESAIPSIKTAAAGAANAAVNEFNNADASGSGANLSAGFASGIRLGMSGVVAAAQQVAQTALAAIRNVGGEHSPWKTTTRSGVYAAQGLALGMRKTSKQVESAGEYIARTLNDSINFAFNLNPVKVAISNISNETKNLTRGFSDSVNAANTTTANLNRLFARTGVRYSKDFIDKIKSGGDEYNKMLADMANWSDEQVQHMVDAFDSVTLAERETDLAARELYVNSLQYFTFKDPRKWMQDFKSTVLDVKEAVYSDRGLSNAMKLAGVTVEELAADIKGIDITMSDFVSSMNGYVEEVSNGFNKMSRDNQTSLNEWISNVRENIRESQNYTKNLQEVFGKLSVDVNADAFRQAVMEGGYEKFGQIISDLARMSSKQIENVIKQYNAAIAEGQKASVQNLQAISPGAEVMNATIQGVLDAESGLVAAASNASLAGAQAVGAQSSKYYQMGQDLSRGVATGITSKTDEIASAMASAVSAALKAAKAAADIKSPSKKAKKEIGWMISRGVSVGITDKANEIRDAMTKAVSNAFGVSISGTVDADGIIWEKQGTFGGKMVAKGIIAGFNESDPMAQLGQSIEKGISALNIAAVAQRAVGDTYNNTSNQTNNFYSPVPTPDEYARQMRLQQHYGLAGKN